MTSHDLVDEEIGNHWIFNAWHSKSLGPPSQENTTR